MKRILTICAALITALCSFAITYPKTSYQVSNGILHKWTGPETEIDFTADAYLLDNVEEIDEYAFEGNTALKSITLSSTVDYICIYAFKGCTNLEKVIFDKKGSGSQLTIDSGAFEDCTSLKSVTFSPYLKTVWDSFENCPALQNFYMDSGHPDMKASGGIIFSKDMTSLVLFPSGRTGHYDLNDKVVEICQNAFAYSSLTSIYLSNKLERIDKEAFDCARNLTTVVFPNSLRSIGRFSFNSCHSLKSLILPPSIETIDYCAFRKCISLPETIKLPASLYEIDGSAFNGCTTVKHFEVAAGSPYLSTIDGVLFNASKDILIMWPWGREDTEYVVPEGVLTIKENAFNTSNLNNVVFPSSLLEIREDAFYHSQLRKVIIPEGVQNINKAFPICELLNEIVLPSTLTDLDKETFRCWTSSKIPRKVTCYSILPIGKWVESDVTTDTLYVPEEGIEMYKVSPGWRAFGTIKAIPEKKYFAVTFKSPDNGLLIVTNNGHEIESGTELEEGSRIEISAVPFSECELVGIEVNGFPIANNSTITVTGPIDIVATFKRVIKTCLVTFEDPAGGSIKVLSDGVEIANGATVAENSTLMIVAEPDAGYELESLKVNESFIDNYSYLTVTGPVSILATFKPIVVVHEFAVTFDEPENGSLLVTKDGSRIANGAMVEENSTLTIVAEPNSGYELESLMVNGVFVENYGSITVTGPVYIEAKFRQIVAEQEFAITFDEPENGILIVAIDGEEVESGTLAKENSVLTVLAIPYTDYVIESLTINGVAIDNNSSRPVTEPMHISATFVPEGTVSIKPMDSIKNKKVIYNLIGQRLSHLQHGFNIVNGKKVVVH